MALIVPVFMISIAYFSGLVLTRVFCDNRASVIKTCLVGTFFLMMILEGLVLLSYRQAWGFNITVRLYCAVVLLILLISVPLCYKKIMGHIKVGKRINPNAVFILCATVFTVFVVLFLRKPDTSADFTADAVNTILSTDTVLKYDYLTGYPLTAEPSWKAKLDFLPFLYGALARIFNLDAVDVVYNCAPVWAMSLYLMVYGLWAAELYKDDKNAELKKAFFVAGVCILSFCGAFSAKSIFYYQTFEGFRGEPVCYGVLMPFCIYELLTLYRNKKWQSVIYFMMAVASAVLVTTPAKGLVPSIIIFAAGSLVAIGYRLRRCVKCLQ